jgi:hypothetical protein
MTTRRQWIVNMLALLLSAGTLFAQDFWQAKEYLTWTNDEITRLTTNSPWAKELKVTAGGKDAALRLTWLTALPIKQAVLRERMDEGGVLAESAKEIMSTEEQYYAVGITGLPADMAQKLTEAALRVPDKEEIKPARGDFQPRGATVDVMILFSRAKPVTTEDKEVEVILKLDGVEIGQKFPLIDMVFNGRLEL